MKEIESRFEKDKRKDKVVARETRPMIVTKIKKTGERHNKEIMKVIYGGKVP